MCSSDLISSLILDGETFIVRFDYKGAWFVCQRVGALLVYQGKTSSGSPTPIPPAMNILPNTSTTPYTSTLPGSTYQILRLPRRIGNPLELSAGTCIDLAYSGIGSMNMPSNTIRYGMYPADPAAPTSTPAANFPGLFPVLPQSLQAITVMFTPGGGIDSVFLNNWFFSPSTTVHFLVGRADKVNAPLGTSSASPTLINMYDPTVSNLADPLALWVSIARSTGNVVTSDNLPPTATAASPTSMNILGGGTQQTIIPNIDAGQVTYLSFCRQLATNREQAKAQ